MRTVAAQSPATAKRWWMLFCAVAATAALATLRLGDASAVLLLVAAVNVPVLALLGATAWQRHDRAEDRAVFESWPLAPAAWLTLVANLALAGLFEVGVLISLALSPIIGGLIAMSSVHLPIWWPWARALSFVIGCALVPMAWWTAAGSGDGRPSPVPAGSLVLGILTLAAMRVLGQRPT